MEERRAAAEGERCPFVLIANRQLPGTVPRPESPRSILTSRRVARPRNFTSASRGPVGFQRPPSHRNRGLRAAPGSPVSSSSSSSSGFASARPFRRVRSGASAGRVAISSSSSFTWDMDGPRARVRVHARARERPVPISAYLGPTVFGCPPVAPTGGRFRWPSGPRTPRPRNGTNRSKAAFSRFISTSVPSPSLPVGPVRQPRPRGTRRADASTLS